MNAVVNNETLNEPTHNQPTSPTPVGMGIFGAIAGAAIGTVAAIYLSDEKNRTHLQKQIHLFRDRAIKVMDTFAEQDKKTEKISKKLDPDQIGVDDIQENVHTIQR